MNYHFIESYNLQQVMINTGLWPITNYNGRYLVSNIVPKLKIKVASTIGKTIELTSGRHILSLVKDCTTGKEMLLIHQASPYTKSKKFIGSKGEKTLREMIKPDVKTFSEWLKSCA
jgi:hypothetical protein